MDPNTQGQQADRKIGDPADRGEKQTDQSNVGRQPVSDREYAEIDARFTPKQINADEKLVHGQIMFSVKDLAEFTIRSIPNNRERALALTKLEEFGTWCEKGLIHGGGKN